MPLDLNTAKKKRAPAPDPKVLGFRLPSKRTGTAQSLISTLGKLSFLHVAQDSQDPQLVLSLNVKSRDISKNPYIFSILYFRPDAIDVLYTLAPNKSPKARRLEVIKYVLNILTLCTNEYELDMKYLHQMIEGAISDMNEYVSLDYQSLFSKYDSLQGEHERSLRTVKSLESSNKELASDNYSLKNKAQELELRLEGLEKYSDSVLAVKLQTWVSEHNGEINLSDFARVHGVSEARVEQVLNNLVSEGYLESRH